MAQDGESQERAASRVASAWRNLSTWRLKQHGPGRLTDRSNSEIYWDSPEHVAAIATRARAADQRSNSEIGEKRL